MTAHPDDRHPEHRDANGRPREPHGADRHHERRKPGLLAKAGAVVGLIISVIYIANPTAGILEVIPDFAPVVGHLDEAAAVALLIGCLRTLGLDLTKWFRRG